MTFARAEGPTERERERCGGLALGPSGGGKVVVGIRESGGGEETSKEEA